MNIDYIIVQAGGKGTRMEHLTANKPKALVPIGNLPMLFHLFKKFPEKKFIIIGDYKQEVLRKYLESFASVQYLMVNANGKKGTCGGLKDALEFLPEDSPFMLIWSDLVLPDSFMMPDEEGDYIGLSQSFPCRWSYRDGVFEESSSTEFGVAGLFVFRSKNSIINVPEEGEFVRWLKGLDREFQTVGISQTKEYGLISEWNKLKGKDTDSRCRPFNSMRVENNRIIKEGIDQQGLSLAVREKAWYKYVSAKGYKQIPEIFSYNPLTMEKINGHNVFEYQLPYERRRTILESLVASLNELHQLDSCPTDYFSIHEAYLTKTFKRLEKVRNLVPFANEEYIDINGSRCRNVFYSKEEIEKRISGYRCQRFCTIHGDNTFSNILLDENLRPVLIDPRGYFGHTELYGDPMYDWAKLYYSLVGNYDQFNLGRFKLDIGEKDVWLSIQSNGWEDMEEYFFELLGPDVNKIFIKLIHSIIWLSLTTYAWEDYDSICGAFYNGLLYLKDVL